MIIHYLLIHWYREAIGPYLSTPELTTPEGIKTVNDIANTFEEPFRSMLNTWIHDLIMKSVD